MTAVVGNDSTLVEDNTTKLVFVTFKDERNVSTHQCAEKDNNNGVGNHCRIN